MLQKKLERDACLIVKKSCTSKQISVLTCLVGFIVVIALHTSFYIFGSLCSDINDRRIVQGTSCHGGNLHTDATSKLKSKKFRKRENSYSLIVYALKISLPLTIKFSS